MVKPEEYPGHEAPRPEVQGFGIVDWADTVVFDPEIGWEMPDSGGLRYAIWRTEAGRQYVLSRAQVRTRRGEAYGIYELRSDPPTEADEYVGFSYDGWKGVTLPRDIEWHAVGNLRKMRLHEAAMLGHITTAPVRNPGDARVAPRFVRQDFRQMDLGLSPAAVLRERALELLRKLGRSLLE
ncbi:MAG TPA: hypothetical protein VLF40_01295 [Candidatus Saccharimonadales bacterium]|nr:hypothetical protein [Candidatus Saccharimonadales bacterium]